MSLTPNEELPTVYEKLAALRTLARHCGFLRRHMTSEETLKRVEQFGAAPAILALLVIMDEGQTAVARAACSTLLEMYLPTWRELVSPSVLGMVVDRGDAEVMVWRSAVLARDGKRCVECGAGEHLHAHHIVRWAVAPWLRLVVDNGLTLCAPCHRAEHARAA